jgi:hypothetical protein
MYGERVDQIKAGNQESVSSQGIAGVLFSRYTFDVPPALDTAESHGIELANIPLILRNLIDTDSIRTQSPLFPDSQIPSYLLENNEFARNVLRHKLDTLFLQIGQTGLNNVNGEIEK